MFTPEQEAQLEARSRAFRLMRASRADLGNMTMTDYAQVRAQYIRRGNSRGIFDQ